MRQVLVGLIGLALIAGAFGVTGYNLVNGGLIDTSVPAFAEFSNCGQGLRVRGDVKLRGVLVGTIKEIERLTGGNCRVTLGLFPDSLEQIPSNVGAQIRAKTVFGEKWVELLYPDSPEDSRLAEDDLIDNDLFIALDRLDTLQRYTISRRDLIAANFDKAPRLLDELTFLFTARFGDFTRLVNSGATIVDLLAARTDDVDRLLDALPVFNEKWIRNLGHNCRYRQTTDEPGKEQGDEVPGRCWRVHNILSESQGPYPPGEEPRPHDGGGGGGGSTTDESLEDAGIDPSDDLGRVLGASLSGSER